MFVLQSNCILGACLWSSRESSLTKRNIPSLTLANPAAVSTLVCFHKSLITLEVTGGIARTKANSRDPKFLTHLLTRAATVCFHKSLTTLDHTGGVARPNDFHIKDTQMGNTATKASGQKHLRPIDILRLKEQSKRNLTHQSSGQHDAKAACNQKIRERMDSFHSMNSSDVEENPTTKATPTSTSKLSRPSPTVDYTERIISCEYGPTIQIGSNDPKSIDAQMLFQYEVLELLGGGSYSQVFLAQPQPTHKPRPQFLRQHSVSAVTITSTSSNSNTISPSMRTTSLEQHTNGLLQSLQSAAATSTLPKSTITIEQTNQNGAAALAAGTSLVNSTSTTPITPTNSNHVAIKIIPKPTDTEQLNNEEYIDYLSQMRQEAAIMKKVSSHAHIVNLIEFVESDLNFYMVLECCRHSCMQTIVDCHYSTKTSYKITELSIAHIFWQVLDALSYIHSCNIAHLDIKPDNILLGMDFQVRLCDFGLSVDRHHDSFPCYRCVHTLLFCPPEILLEQQAYTGTDMWAAGVVLFVLLSGYFPFHTLSGKVSELHMRIKEGPDYVIEHGPMSMDAKYLLRLLLNINVKDRISAKQAMQHPWFSSANEHHGKAHKGDAQERHVSSLRQLTSHAVVEQGVGHSGEELKQISELDNVVLGTSTPSLLGLGDGEGGVAYDDEDDRVLQHPITTAQIFFTHRLSEVEDMFA